MKITISVDVETRPPVRSGDLQAAESAKVSVSPDSGGSRSLRGGSGRWQRAALTCGAARQRGRLAVRAAGQVRPRPVCSQRLRLGSVLGR